VTARKPKRPGRKRQRIMHGSRRWLRPNVRLAAMYRRRPFPFGADGYTAYRLRSPRI
jgi:hypothetical protein